MKTIDVGAVLVTYNFVFGVLLMLASEKAASYVGVLGMGAKATVERYANVTFKAFGGAISVLSGSIYLLVYLLRLGVN